MQRNNPTTTSSTEFTRGHGLIEISTELGTDFIEIDNGQVAHQPSTASRLRYQLEIAQYKLAQLMIGRRTIADLAENSNVSVSKEIVVILGLPFPDSLSASVVGRSILVDLNRFDLLETNGPTF